MSIQNFLKSPGQFHLGTFVACQTPPSLKENSPKRLLHLFCPTVQSPKIFIYYNIRQRKSSKSLQLKAGISEQSSFLLEKWPETVVPNLFLLFDINPHIDFRWFRWAQMPLYQHLLSSSKCGCLNYMLFITVRYIRVEIVKYIVFPFFL